MYIFDRHIGSNVYKYINVICVSVYIYIYMYREMSAFTHSDHSLSGFRYGTSWASRPGGFQLLRSALL